MKPIVLLTRALHSIYRAPPGATPYWDLPEESRNGDDPIVTRRLLLEDSGLPLHGTVLDLGAGEGRWTLPLAAAFDAVLAAEPDAGSRRRLRMRLAEDGDESERVELLAASAEALPIDDAAIDAVFCHHVFQYLDQPRALREIGRVLKPGGRLFITSNGPGYFLLQLALGVRHDRPDRVEFGLKCLIGTALSDLTGRRIVGQRYSSIRRLSRLMAEAGLAVVRARPWESHDHFPLRYMGATTHFAVLAERPAEPDGVAAR